MKIKDFFRKVKGNLYFYIVIFLFIVSYGFFFTSNRWMPPSSAADALTAIGRANGWNGRVITVLRWDYCEELQEMEVELDIKNSTFDGYNSYTYSAMERSGKFPKVEVMLEEADWAVIRIKDVPERWSEIFLNISIGENPDAGGLAVYTNVNDVNRVKHLEKKDWEGYRKGRFERLIQEYENQIAADESQIEALEKQNEQIALEIQRLEEDREYQTSEEQMETDGIIQEAQKQEVQNTDKVRLLKEEITQLQEKISLTKQQMEEVLGND